MKDLQEQLEKFLSEVTSSDVANFLLLSMVPNSIDEERREKAIDAMMKFAKIGFVYHTQNKIDSETYSDDTVLE